MRIRHKILLGYLAFIGSAVVLIGFFLSNLGDINAHYADLMKNDQRILLLLNSLRSGVQRQIVAVRTFQVIPDLSLQYEFMDARKEQADALQQIEPLLVKPQDQETMTNLKVAIERYDGIAKQVMTFPSPPLSTTTTISGTGGVEITGTFSTTNATSALANQALSLKQQMESETARYNLVNAMQGFIVRKTSEVEETSAALDMRVQDVSTQVLLLSLLGGLGALIGAMLLTESFTSPLRRLMRNIQGISSGDLHTAVAVRSRDEIGELAGVLETMRQRLAHTAGENMDLLNSAREEAEKLARTRHDLEHANAELHEALAVESEARKRIEEIDRLKAEFTSMISHELKTPVSYVYNYAGALKEHNNSLNDGQRTEFLTAIQGEAQHLLTLVDDIMAISLLESVGLTHRFVETDLRKLTDSVVKDQQLTTRRHTITVKGPEKLPVRADPTRLKQVMNNLLSNAIKYSPQGGPIEVRLRANTADDTATVYVRDHGIGIDPQDVPKLFDRFMRIQRKETMAIPGSGLGLYIAHHIVQAHGGILTIEPAPGSGTIAQVTVPLINTAQEDAPEPEEVEVAVAVAHEPRKNGRAHRVENNGVQRNNGDGSYESNGNGDGDGNGRKNVRITSSDTGTHTIITVDKDRTTQSLVEAEEVTTTKA
ncbi:MAG: two-component system, OmpR family, phosphate regulon sensor histidine kinase PhoR [Chloroflexia bacterium]|jgi:signal transduction histidine kinase|nr:two-component system, OmpR family, phosphate regulon sensor histidine kinase PhoR [Chloroflexia bacterium]